MSGHLPERKTEAAASQQAERGHPGERQQCDDGELPDRARCVHPPDPVDRGAGHVPVDDDHRKDQQQDVEPAEYQRVDRKGQVELCKEQRSDHAQRCLHHAARERIARDLQRPREREQREHRHAEWKGPDRAEQQTDEAGGERDGAGIGRRLLSAPAVTG